MRASCSSDFASPESVMDARLHDVARGAQPRARGARSARPAGSSRPARDVAHDLEDLRHHQRREAHRRLVEQQQLRAGSSARARWRASAARRRRACRRSGVRRSRRRGKARVLRFRRRLLRRAHVGAHREVLLDGELREDAAALGHHDEARCAAARARCARDDVRAGVLDASARATASGRQIAFERRGLARAVGADQADQLALVDLEVDALHGADAAVAHLEVLAPQAACGALRDTPR